MFFHHQLPAIIIINVIIEIRVAPVNYLTKGNNSCFNLVFPTPSRCHYCSCRSHDQYRCNMQCRCVVMGTIYTNNMFSAKSLFSWAFILLIGTHTHTADYGRYMAIPGPSMEACMSVTSSSFKKTLMPSGGLWVSSVISRRTCRTVCGWRFSTLELDG